MERVQVAVFPVTEQGGSSGREEEEQVDPLGRPLVHAQKQRHYQQQQRSAADPQAESTLAPRPQRKGRSHSVTADTSPPRKKKCGEQSRRSHTVGTLP